MDEHADGGRVERLHTRESPSGPCCPCPTVRPAASDLRGGRLPGTSSEFCCSLNWTCMMPADRMTSKCVKVHDSGGVASVAVFFDLGVIAWTASSRSSYISKIRCRYFAMLSPLGGPSRCESAGCFVVTTHLVPVIVAAHFHPRSPGVPVRFQPLRDTSPDYSRWPKRGNHGCDRSSGGCLCRAARLALGHARAGRRSPCRSPRSWYSEDCAHFV